MYEIIEKQDRLRLLAISDLHLCHKLDRLDLLYKAYQYAVDNNIKYVLNLGDLIEGVMPHNKYDIKEITIDGQVKYVLDNYPYSDKIKTLVLYGNHDFYEKYKGGIDVAQAISSERNDLINLGYGEAYIKVLDNYIKLSHEISLLKKYKKDIETFINLYGHLHKFKTKIYDDKLYVHVPSLSNVSPTNTICIPEVLDINISFTKNIISNFEIDLIDMEKGIVNSSFEIASSINNKKYIKIKNKIDEYNL